MSKIIEVTSEAIEVICNNCPKDDSGEHPMPYQYKTTNTETFKCIQCGSRDIITSTSSPITHKAPDEDDDES